MTPHRFQKITEVLAHRQPDLTVLMEDVHKPHNLAAIARTCEAVGIGEVHAVVTGRTVNLRPKAASGCGKWLSLFQYRSIQAASAQLKDRGFSLVAAHVDAQATDFRDQDYTAPTALLIGAELHGLSARALAAADRCVRVPMVGMVRSLNVSVAVSLILYEALRQRTAAGLYERRRLPDDEFERLRFEWAHPTITDYCKRHNLPYPALDDAGAIVGPVPRDGHRKPRAAG